eukprot:4917643-Lingulodinium_polyedra.AAC.1
MVARVVDGPGRRALVRPRRLRRLRRAPGQLQVRKRLSGAAARRLAGHLVDVFSIRPALAACLFQLYRCVGPGND